MSRIDGNDAELQRALRDREAIASLGTFFVQWKMIDPDDVEAFEGQLRSARHEKDIQSFLERYPWMIVQALSGGHGRWVIPQKRLGSEYVTDFVIGEKDSVGFHWTALELEHPNTRTFTRKGDPSAPLTHALQQVRDWRYWLSRNQAYAERDRSEGGLGLRNIDPQIPGLILMGRRELEYPGTETRRRQLAQESNVAIHTYDWLIDQANSVIGWIYRTRPTRRQAHEAAGYVEPAALTAYRSSGRWEEGERSDSM